MAFLCPADIMLYISLFIFPTEKLQQSDTHMGQMVENAVADLKGKR